MTFVIVPGLFPGYHDAISRLVLGRREMILGEGSRRARKPGQGGHGKRLLVVERPPVDGRFLFWMGVVVRIRISADTIAGPFVDQIEQISGQNLLACNQCGKCSAGCPVADTLDLLPSAVLRMAQLGLREVLQAQTLWTCASCLTCVSRCPKGVDLPRIMEALRNIAMNAGIQPVNVAALEADLLAELPQMAVVGGFRKYSL